MIKKVEPKIECSGKYLVNATNLDLEIADANARGMSCEHLINRITKEVHDYLIDALLEVEK